MSDEHKKAMALQVLLIAHSSLLTAHGSQLLPEHTFFPMAGVILSGAAFQAERRISRIKPYAGRSLGPLVTTRAFGMTGALHH
ncbi:MAG TPA: hypothetical protein VKQ11_20680 [Candidatus Sulfotelmatobacter sp.]|nr:hypothetical protein [Candidatus Sulfotelmatobacter sp.]